MRAWHHTYGLPVVLSNCSNNYGPYHFPEKLVPLIILNALEGKPLPIFDFMIDTSEALMPPLRFTSDLKFVVLIG